MMTAAQTIQYRCTSHMRSKPKLTCFRCGKLGYFKNQCRMRIKLKSHITSSSTLRELTPARPSSIRHHQRPSKECTSKPKLKYQSKTLSNIPKGLKQVHYLIQSNLSEVEGNNDAWVLDTGDTHNFCKDRNLYKNFKPLYNKEMVVAINGATFLIEETGLVYLELWGEIVCFGNVMYFLKLRRNLISGSRLDSSDIKFKGGNDTVKASNQAGEILFRADIDKGIYYIYLEIPKNIRKVKFEGLMIQKDDIKIWHRCLEHISPTLIEGTYKNKSVGGLPYIKDTNFNCETCKVS